MTLALNLPLCLSAHFRLNITAFEKMQFNQANGSSRLNMLIIGQTVDWLIRQMVEWICSSGSLMCKDYGLRITDYVTIVIVGWEFTLQ